MTEAPHRCGGCPARWSGAARAHCATCHLTFGGVTTFDAHRVGGEQNRKCLTPADLAERGITATPLGVYGRAYFVDDTPVLVGGNGHS